MIDFLKITSTGAHQNQQGFFFLVYGLAKNCFWFCKITSQVWTYWVLDILNLKKSFEMIASRVFQMKLWFLQNFFFLSLTVLGFDPIEPSYCTNEISTRMVHVKMVMFWLGNTGLFFSGLSRSQLITFDVIKWYFQQDFSLGVNQRHEFLWKTTVFFFGKVGCTFEFNW